MNKTIFVEACPADAIREEIERCIKGQKECRDKGIDISEDYLIPSRVVLSPESMKFFVESKLVDFWGSGPTGEELSFYWKESGKFPALEVRTLRDTNGEFILTYIKEDAGNNKEEFIWDKNTIEGKLGQIVVAKKTDALEDITSVK